MTSVDDRTAYLNNPYFTKHIYGDFTPFYITITACTLFGLFLFALNLICGLCSQHKSYWNDRWTGNRWLVALFTATAHKQPPLDLSELENVKIDYPNKYPGEVEHTEYVQKPVQKARRGYGSGYGSLKEFSPSFEEAPFAPQPQRPPRPGGEFELQKRESEI